MGNRIFLSDGKRRRTLLKSAAPKTERPCTPSQSLAQSLKEMILIRQGKLPKKSWWDYIKEKEKG